MSLREISGNCMASPGDHSWRRHLYSAKWEHAEPETGMCWGGEDKGLQVLRLPNRSATEETGLREKQSWWIYFPIRISVTSAHKSHFHLVWFLEQISRDIVQSLKRFTFDSDKGILESRAGEGIMWGTNSRVILELRSLLSKSLQVARIIYFYVEGRI